MPRKRQLLVLDKERTKRHQENSNYYYWIRERVKNNNYNANNDLYLAIQPQQVVFMQYNYAQYIVDFDTPGNWQLLYMERER